MPELSEENTVDALRARVADLEQQIVCLTRERDEVHLAWLFETNRAYDENAARCFENRRVLARQIGNFFSLDRSTMTRLLKFATEADHGYPHGGSYMRWIVEDLRSSLAAVTAKEIP